MLIRTELLQPNVHVFGANQYLTLVGMHGAMMMGIMSSSVLGPFANWLVPLNDRDPADGLPADRVVHLLAVDGRRGGPDHDDLLRRLSDGLDRVSATRGSGHRRL